MAASLRAPNSGVGCLHFGFGVFGNILLGVVSYINSPYFVVDGECEVM